MIAALLEHPDILSKCIFTTADAERILGRPRRELNLALSRLVRKGKIARIRNSLFCLGNLLDFGHCFSCFMACRYRIKLCFGLHYRKDVHKHKGYDRYKHSVESYT